MAPRPGTGTIVAAILLPPLGVFLARGLGREFWIGAALTLVGWLPGVIFALVTILRPRDGEPVLA
jgi:uncharacterized membrane protein YqaE (UPF0057 family)